MSKFKINFYAFYVMLGESAFGKNQLVISKQIKKISSTLEKEINSLLKKSNIKFKIFYDVIDDKNASIDHYKKIINKNNINVIGQAPGYFECDDWSQFLDRGIYLDSFNRLKGVSHKNIFRTRISFGFQDAVDQIETLFPNTKIIFPILSERNEITEKQLKDLDQFESGNPNVYLRFISDWRENNYNTLREFFSSTKKDEIVLLSGYINPFQVEKSSSKKHSKLTYSNSRLEFLSVYLEAKYEFNLVGLSLDTRFIHNALGKFNNTFNNKIFNLFQDDFVEKLAMQDRIFSANSITEQEVSDYLNWYYSIIFDKVLLIYYIYSKKNNIKLTNDNFLYETRKRLSKLDGGQDVFVGSGDLIYFHRQRRPLTTNYLVEIKTSSIYEDLGKPGPTQFIKSEKDLIDSEDGEKNIKMSLYKKQLVTKGDLSTNKLRRVKFNFTKKIVDVNYPNFDFIDIKDVSIEDNTFKSNFYFELTTPHKEGIDIIRFNNITDNDPEVKLIKSEKIENDYYYFRYYVSAKFYFFSKAESYPFDMQNVFVSYSIIDEKYGILNTIKNQEIDRKFNSHGWDISSVRSGVIRKKENYHPHFKESYVLISEENRISYIMSRKSSFTVIKILIPLVFLIALVIYGMYLPVEQIDRVIALLTTSFLSGIALYFSTERPNPLTLTIVDYIFIIFYLIVGGASVAVFVFDFFDEYYSLGLAYSRGVLFLFTFISTLYLYHRARSFKSRINLDGSED